MCNVILEIDSVHHCGELGDGAMTASQTLLAFIIIRTFQLVFQPEQYFPLTTNQPEQCCGLFFQRNERGHSRPGRMPLLHNNWKRPRPTLLEPPYALALACSILVKLQIILVCQLMEQPNGHLINVI